jgi:hypothetical protein
MRIPKINASSYKSKDFESVTETIDVDLLERVEFDPNIDPEDTKEFPKTIKAIKFMCRQVFEYKSLMQFLKEHRGFYTTAIYRGIVRTMDKKFSVEVHHVPFVMEDIVVTVIYKRMSNGESLQFLDICEEIMRLHYEGLVGLVPLDKTTHALIHSENAPEVFYPLQFIDFGDYHEFYRRYKKYIPDNVKAAYSYHQDLSMQFEKLEDAIPDYMKPKQLYWKGFVKIDEFEKILDDLKK